MSAQSARTRDDFRCELCRQKSVFHCEHDTPYRDEYLGTSDILQTQRRTPNTGRRSKNENSPMKNNQNNNNNNRTTTNNNVNGKTSRIDTQRTGNGKGVAPQYQQQGKRQQQQQIPGNDLARAQAQEQKGKSKSCVIL